MTAVTTTITVGGITVTPLQDGTGRECARDVLKRHDDASAWDEHPEETDEHGDLHLTLGGFLVRTGDRVVLIDAGVGTIDNGHYRGGMFLEQLRSHGVDASDVTDVAFTHLHFDHVGWATQKGQVVFENATHHVHAADWNFFVEDVNSDAGAVRKLSPLQSRLATFDAGTTLAAGLDARPAVGHTPGSTVYVVSDAGERLVLLGDVAHHPLELTQDGWSFRFDHSKEQAIASRREIVEEFANTPTLLAAGHFPDLRPGRLAGSGDALTWNTL
jgi:glyoxylase-like metal-dependent hydrolase (beta-lactamase superfamily II)